MQKKLKKSDLKVGMKVIHTNRCQKGVVTSLETSDTTSCIVDFEDNGDLSLTSGENEVTIVFLEKIKSKKKVTKQIEQDKCDLNSCIGNLICDCNIKEDSPLCLRFKQLMNEKLTSSK
jgi:hypothetical protein